MEGHGPSWPGLRVRALPIVRKINPARTGPAVPANPGLDGATLSQPG